MPGIEDWVNSPLQIIQRIFDECGGKEDLHSSKVHEYFDKRAQDPNALSWVPLLNACPPHQLPSHTLVRYHGMIQDMFDPEFYLGAYEVENKESGKLSMKCGKYRDLAQCGPDEVIKLESARNKTLDRHTYYCVPIPGQNAWVKEANSSQCRKSHNAPSTSSSASRPKRPLEENGVSQATHCDDNTMETDTDACNDSGDASSKKPKSSAEGDDKAPQASAEHDLNFPLPDETGPACIVKVYGDESHLKVNDAVEFIGVLSNDPALANFRNDSDEGVQSAVQGDSGMEDMEEDNAHCPPPSLVPRLHALVIRKLEHNNPHLPQNCLNSPEGESVMAECKKLREEVVAVLTQALEGDSLSAEYLLCHLISSVYARHDVVALGKFSLNLSGCPSVLPSKLYALIESLVTKSFLLPMTICNMNSMNFVPRKDYVANRLKSGILQLSEQSHLVVDETVLQPGQLDTKGVANMTALGNVINWQKLDYDFNYHKQEFPTNICCLVLSEGKSILKCDCQAPLQMSVSPDKLVEAFSGIDTYLTPDLLNRMRCYFTVLQHLPYSLPETMQKKMEGEFVERRKEDANSYSVDDFHSLLVLTRLQSISRGESTLTDDVFERTKDLETQRRLRLTQGQGTRPV